MSESRLGPECLGSRVVIRRLVPGETGPTGGPAMTDVIGILASWGEDVVVESTVGTFTFPRSLIVAGKVIGPQAKRSGS